MERMDGDDAAEVARARSGDEGAFRTLVERHGRALFRLAYRMTGNEHDAEDVVQEAFLKAFRRLDQFEDRAHFGSWLYRIAANCAYDALRSRARREERSAIQEPQDADDPLASVPAEGPSPERLVFSGQVQERVHAAMARLSERERAAFVLRHFEQMSTREIGEALGLDEAAVKHSVFRAVRKLREALESLVAARAGAEAR
jgi:RNA polymerase sigma-70 factor (ECF subfamily)